MMERNWRVWDKVLKRMIYPDYIQFQINHIMITELDEDIQNTSFKMEQCEVMDWINFYHLPKKMKLYEDDIITCKHWDWQPHILKYSERGAAYMIHIPELSSPMGFISEQLSTTFKLLGNVWENPEIINDYLDKDPFYRDLRKQND